MKKERMLVQMTLDELVDALKEQLPINQLIGKQKEKQQYVYGQAGLANLLGCSVSTAARLLKSNKIAPAVSRYQRKIIIDAELALKLLNENNLNNK